MQLRTEPFQSEVINGQTDTITGQLLQPLLESGTPLSTGNFSSFNPSKIEHYEKWVAYFPTKEPEDLRDFFYSTYQAYSISASRRYISHRMPYRSLLDPEDIKQQADYGLLEAINSFDPYRGVSFKTHSFRRIHGSIIDGLRALQDFPRFVAKVRRRIEPLISKLQQELQRPPLTEDIIARFPYFKVDGVPIRTLILDKLITVNVFNQTQKEEKPEFSRHDIAPIVCNMNEEDFGIETFNPVELCLLKRHHVDAEGKKLKRIDLINYVLHVLDDNREQQIILMYYFGGKTTNQIAKILRLSVACVSAKKISAIDKLKLAAKNSDTLMDLIYE